MLETLKSIPKRLTRRPESAVVLESSVDLDAMSLGGASDLLPLRDVQWDTGRLLRFVDGRLEDRYWISVAPPRRRTLRRLLVAWMCISALEFFFLGYHNYVTYADASAMLCTYGRMILFFELLLLLALERWRDWDQEIVSQAVGILLPVNFMIIDLYRTSAAFGTDFWQKRYRDIDPELELICYSPVEEAFLITLLFCIVQVPFMLSCRFARVWWILPYVVIVYLLCSITGIGPGALIDHVVLCVMFSVACGTMLISGYQIETDSRDKWMRNLKLQIEAQQQKNDIIEHQLRAQELQDRLAALKQDESHVAMAGKSSVEEETAKTVPRPIALPPPPQ